MQQVHVIPDDEMPPAVLAAVRELTFEAFGGRFSAHDWEHTQGGWRIVAFQAGVPVSHAAVVPRRLWVADRVFAVGYLEGVASRPDRQRQGFGSMVVRSASALVRERYELGGLSTSRPAFYQRLGWERWHGPTFVRAGDDLVRTPEEDAGVLVLRSGPRAELDLAAPITCESRPGDDW